jgi:hypothetical protein
VIGQVVFAPGTQTDVTELQKWTLGLLFALNKNSINHLKIMEHSFSTYIQAFQLHEVHGI